MLEWDEAKRAANLIKHGVDFAAAERLDWTAAVVIEDDRHDYGETRLRVAAPIDGRWHMAVVTPRDGRLRIISLRRANAKERRLWASATRS
ncbi:BrnT family toxin [Paracoccus sp. S-4012]|uniref:BrnT family toxin n=1 Tax=Paracoccus sp. S-4012 TaxID=2665648 RepID=UPI0012B013CF|nr:BrnT family toxin [Paracoccus sp. S-4012]MRX51126.1 BrnT family toxin [Paracoccus sp. S-4012]